MKERLEKAYDYLKSQLSEASTLRGLLVLISMGYGEARSWPLDHIVTVGVIVGSVFKILLPDNLWKSSQS